MLTLRKIASILGVPAYTLLKDVIEFSEEPEEFLMNEERKDYGKVSNRAEDMVELKISRRQLEEATKSLNLLNSIFREGRAEGKDGGPFEKLPLGKRPG